MVHASRSNINIGGNVNNVGQSSQLSLSKSMLTPNLNSGANNARASTSSPANLNGSAFQQTTRSQSRNTTGPIDYPSTIGRAIDDTRVRLAHLNLSFFNMNTHKIQANKRDSPSLDISPQKRRKIGSSANTSSLANSASHVMLPPSTMAAGWHSAPLSSSKLSATPLGIASNSIPTTPSGSSFRKRSPRSPDMSFVPYVAKRKKEPVATSSTAAGNSRSKSVIISEIIELSSSDEEVAQMLSHKKRKVKNNLIYYLRITDLQLRTLTR